MVDPLPLYSVGDTLVFTGDSIEEERPGQTYNYYSYYESGTTEIGETYTSTSSGQTNAELSYLYLSEDNDQGIVDFT